MSKSTSDDPGQLTTLDDWTDAADDSSHTSDDDQRQDDDGYDGARYRHTATTAPDDTASLSRECQGCGSHVSKQFVRVFGVDGGVDACPECAGHTGVLNGAATPGLEGHR